MRRLSIGFATLALVLGLTGKAEALAITGSIGFGGAVIYDNLCTDCPAPGTEAGAAIIDFLPPGTGVGTAQATIFTMTGYFAGNGGVSGVNDGALANDGLTAGSLSDIQDMTNVFAASAPGGPAYAPGGPNFVADFIDNLLDPDAEDLHFDLTEVLLQSGPNCAISLVSGCVASGIFKLTQEANGVSVDFDVLGNFVNGTDFGYFQGIFGAEFNGHTLASLFAAIDAGNDIDCSPSSTNVTPCTWSANFIEAPDVPEPATLLTLGIGASALAASRRRRAKKAQQ